MQNSIVCAVDGSRPSRAAAQVAAQLARTLNLRLILAYATEDRPTFPYGEPVDGLRWRALGDDARLIVVGSRGRRALSAAVLSSVSGVPAATAPLPVLVMALQLDAMRVGGELGAFEALGAAAAACLGNIGPAFGNAGPSAPTLGSATSPPSS